MASLADLCQRDVSLVDLCQRDVKIMGGSIRGQK